MKTAVRNGQLIPEEQACVPVSIREVFFNVSVYESLKVLQGTAVFLEDHLDRLLDSARRLEIPCEYSKEQLADMAYRLIDRDSIDRATLRIQLIGGSSPLLFILHTDLPEYPSQYYCRGVKVITYPGERVIPEVKSTSLLLNYVAQREASRTDALEALFVDRDGYAIEGTRTNIFAVQGKTLLTAKSGVLAGVTRKYIIESAKQLGLSVQYEWIRLEDMERGMFDELFLSSTSMGAMPVRWVNHHCISSEFSSTLHIHQRVRALEALYIKDKRSRKDNG